jgi:hypothetical protein
VAHIVFVRPTNQPGKYWLEKHFDQLSLAFQGAHGDQRHKLSLETKFVPGVVLYESADAFPRIQLLVGDEEHARQTVEEIRVAIEKVGGNADEFEVGSCQLEVMG